MGKRELYLRKLNQQLKSFDNELKKLEEKAKLEMNIVNENFQDQIKSLKKKEAVVRHKLDDIRKSGEHAWEDLKPGLQNSFEIFKDSMHKAMDNFS